MMEWWRKDGQPYNGQQRLQCGFCVGTVLIAGGRTIHPRYVDDRTTTTRSAHERSKRTPETRARSLRERRSLATVF